jgi:hypothetical protein
MVAEVANLGGYPLEDGRQGRQPWWQTLPAIPEYLPTFCLGLVNTLRIPNTWL